MASVPVLIYAQEFSNVDSISVDHGYGSINLYAKIIVDSISHPELIKSVDLDATDPKNKLVVNLSAQQTGLLQLFASDLVNVCDGNPSFGMDPHEEESLNESSVTETTWHEKLRLSATDLPAGRYRIGWSYSWRGSSTSADFLGRLMLDDTTVVMDHRQKPANNATDQNIPCSGFAYVDLMAGDHHFTVEYASETDTTTAYIWNARMEFWRKS